jgi:uncharacterized repeat protein (TIGR01451 family)
MSRTWLALMLCVSAAAALRAEPTTGLPPIPWPVPAENEMPRLNVPRVMRPQQPIDAPPMPMPAPLFYVRLSGPPGSQATFYRGSTNAETVKLPAVVGFRPGYQYRCAISGIPGRPGVTYYPTFEIRGTVALTNKLKASDFPASVVFAAEDMDKLAQGTMVRKIIVLERPETAIPRPSGPDSPVEVAIPPGVDAFTEARERGLPLAYVYFGQRTFDPEEMAAPTGTIMLPGDTTLPPPERPTTIPFICFPLIDPVLGPMHPSQFVSVYDGGDSGLPVGFDVRGKLAGVDPSDTVAEYVNSAGTKKIAISNKVALCIPRYILMRTEVTPGVREMIASPDATLAKKTPVTIEGSQELIERVQKLQLELARTTARATSTDSVYGTTIAGAIKSTKISFSIQPPLTLNGQKMPDHPQPDGPLLICKWPDRAGANIGDILTWHLRYTNSGKQPITDVVLVDNLTPRFEYIPGSAKTDRDATFTFQPNNAGSHLLRWQFSGELAPGEGGVVTFQVRVR